MARGRFRVKATVKVEVSDGPIVFWDEENSTEAAEDMKRAMQARFGAGSAPNAKPWKPYSPRYARENPGVPDNVATGGWRAAIEATASDEEAVCGVDPSDPRAEGWAYADSMRPLSGLSPETIEEVVSDWEKSLDERLGKKPIATYPRRAAAIAAANRRKAERPKRKTRKKV